MEEEITTVTNDSTSNASSISPPKSRRGRSQGSKKLKVCVTDLHLMELVSGISNVGSTQPQRKRGHPRPSHTKHTEDQGPGDDSKLQGSEDDDAEDLSNGGPGKSAGGESEGSPAIPTKRGRPKGSLNKNRKRVWESCGGGAEDDEGRTKVKRERGRPRRVVRHQSECSSTEEEITTAGNDSASSPTKSRRGRSQGSKKLKVCVTDLHLVELVSGISDVASTQPQRKRGRERPSHTKHTEDQESAVDSELQGSENENDDEDDNDDDDDDDDDAKDLAIGGSVKPEGGESEGSPPTVPRKRGRPKGSLNKYRRGMWESYGSGAEDDEGRMNLRRGRGRPRKLVSHTEETPNGISDRPRRGRGRPKKNSAPASGLAPGLATGEGEQVKRGRGRPKGSLNKKPRAQPTVPMFNMVRRRRPGRPKKHEVRKRGRPRKNPLPSPEELKKPKVWKPLGRPRKYPRPDPPDDVPLPPRRKRGRPRKSSRKGAHLRKPRSLHKPAKVLAPPPTHRKEGEAPRKRGRPKGSLNKNRFRGEIEIPSLNRITSSPSNVVVEAAAATSDEGEE